MVCFPCSGDPQPPSVMSSILNTDTLLITWEQPFTWDLYPITEYSIVIETADSNLQDNNTVLINTTLSPSIFSYNVTSEEVPECTELAITMTARNSIGRSAPQVSMAALPDGKSYKQLEHTNFSLLQTETELE